jgi:hypothetical protein
MERITVSSGKPRPVPGFDGYFADRSGRIFSTKKGRMRERKQDRRGRYPRTILWVDNRRKEVLSHRMVCLAFHGLPPSPAHLVRHLNGKKHDNRADNLVWGTPTENCNDKTAHGTQYWRSELHRKRSTISNRRLRKVTVQDIEIMRWLRFKRDWSVARIARVFELSKTHTFDILRGRFSAGLVVSTGKVI